MQRCSYPSIFFELDIIFTHSLSHNHSAHAHVHTHTHTHFYTLLPGCHYSELLLALSDIHYMYIHAEKHSVCAKFVNGAAYFSTRNSQ